MQVLQKFVDTLLFFLIQAPNEDKVFASHVHIAFCEVSSIHAKLYFTLSHKMQYAHVIYFYFYFPLIASLSLTYHFCLAFPQCQHP